MVSAPIAPARLRRRPRFRARRGTRRGRVPGWVMGLAVGTAALANVPLVYLFVRSAEAGWSAWWRAVASPLTADLVARTLALVGGVLALALAVALPAAWLVARTDLPGRRFWAVVVALPLVFPSYVAAFAFVAAFGPRGWAEPLWGAFGGGAVAEVAYGYSGALLVLGLFTYPYVYLLLVAALSDLDPALEECSRGLGAGRWRTFARVVVPQLRAPLYAGSLLVVLYTLSDFGAVSIVRYNTFTLAIYNAYRGLFDRTQAACLATVLVVLALLFIAAEGWLLGRARPTRSRPARPPAPARLGRWKLPAVGGLSLLVALTVGVPVAVVLSWGVRAVAVGNPLGSSGAAAWGSLTVSLPAAVVAVALALPVAYWASRRPSPVSRTVEKLGYAGFALPGIVIALALVFLVTRHLLPLYQTIWVVVAAYVIRFLPEALAAARSALAAVAPIFEEAALSLGRRPAAVVRSVVLPLLGPGLAAGGGLVFLTAMKELPATLILRPTGFETLATRIWSTASEGIYSQAAVPALLLVAVSAPPVWALVIRPALAGRGWR